MSTVIENRLQGLKNDSFYPLVLPVVFSVFTLFLTMGMGFGILPAFVHDRLGYSNIIVGLVIGVEDLTALCTRALGGKCTDTKGPKYAVKRGIMWGVIAGMMYAATAIFSDMPFFPIILLILARIVHGVSESYLITGALAWGIGLAGMRQSGKVMVWVGISLYAGIGLGAPLGGFVDAHFGILSAFALIILFPLLGSLPLLSLPKIETMSIKTKDSFFKIVGLISRQGASFALSAIGFGCISSFAALFFTSKGWGDASLAFAIFASTYILTRLFFASFPDKYGGYMIAIVSLVIEIIGQLFLWLAVSKAMALTGCALTGIGFSLMFPAMGVEAAKKVKPEQRGSAMGAYTAFTDLALGLTGPIAGLIANYFNYQTIYLFGSVCCVLSFLLIISRRRECTFLYYLSF